MLPLKSMSAEVSISNGITIKHRYNAMSFILRFQILRFYSAVQTNSYIHTALLESII